MPIRARGLRSGIASGPVAFDVSKSAAAAIILVVPHLDAAIGGSTQPTVAGLIAAEAVPDPESLPPGAFPVVAGCDQDLFTSGDSVRMDGFSGEISLDGVREHEVVTSLLVLPDGRVLLLKRSDRVGSFRGRWAGVSGFLEGQEPQVHALKEIREETGVPSSALKLLAQGAPVYSRDASNLFIVHPFAFLAASDRVRLDWEHTAYEWLDPGEIRNRPTVPKLERVWAELEAGVRDRLRPAPSETKS